MNALIGVDVGATRISGGLVTPDEGEVVAVEQRATHVRGKGTAVETLLEVIDTMLAEARAREFSVQGIGVGLAGAMDGRTGTMIDADGNHVREFAGLRLADRIGTATGLPAFVENDANALALAEWTFGLGRGASSLALVAIGTEVGGALIVDDTLVRGHSGFGGELGHVTVAPHGLRCVCGHRGCANAYLSGRAVALTGRRRARRGSSKLTALAGGDPDAITSELVFEAARLDDRIARAIVSEACEALAALLGTIVSVLDPEVLVVTGGVAGSLEALAGDIRHRLERRALAHPLARTRLHIVSGDKTRTVRGGAAVVLYEMQRKMLKPERS
jgi:glucokinase